MAGNAFPALKAFGLWPLPNNVKSFFFFWSTTPGVGLLGLLGLLGLGAPGTTAPAPAEADCCTEGGGARTFTMAFKSYFFFFFKNSSRSCKKRKICSLGLFVFRV